MNNITFIIGNGFDLGLGLKSSYLDFYPYFIKKHPNNLIVKLLIASTNNRDMLEDYMNLFLDPSDENFTDINAFLKFYENVIKGIDIDTWADLEITLGKLTEHIHADNYEDFCNDKMDMDICLLKYLKEESNKHAFTDEDYSLFRQNILKKIYEGNNPNQKEFIAQLINRHSDNEFYYFLINFNYTFTADHLFKNNSVYGSHVCRSNKSFKKDEKFIKTLHIHGTIDSDEAIIGVNDDSQISNSKLIQETEIGDFLIKTNQNTTIGKNNTEEATKIIENSLLICLYGVSLGESDQIWWNAIGSWLKNNSDTLLIVFCHYNEDRLDRFHDHIQAKKRVIKAEIDNVLKKLNLQDNTDVNYNNLKNRIIIYINNYINK